MKTLISSEVSTLQLTTQKLTRKTKNIFSTKFLFVITLTFSLLLSACSGNVESTEIGSFSNITKANEHIGISFLQLAEPDEDGNIFISPTSALIAMLMVYNGTEGDTREEIEKALKLDGLSEKEVNEAARALMDTLHQKEEKIEVKLANSLWLNEDYSFNDDFSKKMNDYFAAEIDEIDIFDDASADRINNWVKKETNGLIDEIVEAPLPENLLSYIINALYFNGTWKYEFNKDMTFDDLFYTENGEKDMQFMTINEELPYFETDELQAIKLPYGDGKMNMQVFLPKENVAIDDVVRNMTEKTWENWQDSFKEEEGTINLPKFSLEYETILNEPLQQLGIQEAFSDRADFSKMVPPEVSVYISEVKQKTFIEVDEEGTEAAAVTSVEITLESTIEDDPRFYMHVNRPFLFAIYDESSETILFLGLIKSPEANE